MLSKRTHLVKVYPGNRRCANAICAVTACGKDSAKQLARNKLVAFKHSTTCPHCLRKLGHRGGK